VTTLQGIEMT